MSEYRKTPCLPVRIVLLLFPGIALCFFPETFFDGLWNSMNLLRVAGGILVAVFGVLLVRDLSVFVKNRF